MIIFEKRQYFFYLITRLKVIVSGQSCFYLAKYYVSKIQPYFTIFNNLLADIAFMEN